MGGKTDVVTFIRNDEVASWAFQSFKTLDNGKLIAVTLANGKCLAICDGSYQSELGTAAWIITDELESGYVQGSTWVPGILDDQSAYRSELAGIYSIIWLVNRMCEYYSLTCGAITLGCDGLGPLRQCFSPTNPSKNSSF